MARLRIGVAHTPDEAPRARPRGKKSDVEEIGAVLRHAGHDVIYLPVGEERRHLWHLGRIQADLVFNLVESFGGDDTKEPWVAAYLELLGLHYTGSGPRGLALAMDKALTKKVLHFHGIRTPKFLTVFRGRVDWAHDLDFPVIVKPAREDGSIGIGFGAVVGSIKELMERIDALHTDFNHPVLIEQYIEGREIYVGVIGNAEPEPLPPVELDLSHLPSGTPRIAGTEVKWQEGTRAYRGSRARVVRDLPDDVVATVRAAAAASFQALSLRDYARFDFRIAADGTAYLIEANPNPHLYSGAEFIMAARASGRTHPGTVREIAELALRRYGVKA